MSTTDAATPRPTKRAWSGGMYGAHTKVEHDVVAAQFDQHVLKTYGRYPLTIVRGEGCKLFDSNGNEYLDFVAGISTCALGHANADLCDAVDTQMRSLHHVSNLYYIPAQAELAQWLTRTVGGADRAFFCNSGAEANEAAIKLARKHAGKTRGVTAPQIITAESSFHGRTLGALSATGQPKYQEGFGPLVPGFTHVPYNDVAALREAAAAASRQPSLLRRLARRALGRGPAPTRGLAAILLEPLQGEGGIRPGEKAYFDAAREICDETGALLMFDEVQTGVGRTGKVWGHEHLDARADVLSCAKALGGGVPIGAMVCSATAAASFGPGDHASTFGGNPLACAAALAVTRALDADGGALVANADARGAQLRDGLRALQAARPDAIADVRGWGLINGVELAEGAKCGDAAAVVGAAMKAGLLLVPAGARVVRFVPPLIVSEAEIARALEIFAAAL